MTEILTASGVVAKLPEFVYLVTVDGEWSVSALAGDHPHTPDAILKEVDRRTQGEHVQARGRAHVWRVRATDAVELEVIPPRTIAAALVVKTS